jgi:hypothetical protein
MSKETYKKIYIKSVDDLPKEEGNYVVGVKSVYGFDEYYWYSHKVLGEINFQDEYWINNFSFYLQPIESPLPEITDEEIDVYVNLNHNYINGEISEFNKGLTNGIKQGAKWYRSELKKRV